MRGLWRVQQQIEAIRNYGRLLSAQNSVRRFPKTRNRQKSSLSVPLIVTLTSFPARFPTLAATLKSLLDQEMLADRTILWIAHKDLEKLPVEVTALVENGLDIRGCDDLRSYKKLIPAIIEYPEACFVTADDDVYYRPDWLSNLVRCYDPSSPSVVAARAHLARFDSQGFALPYRSWQLATDLTRATSANEAIFPTGVGGVLYPPGSLHPDVTNVSKSQSICPYGDDIWFFWMARINGFTHIKVPEEFAMIEWPSSQGEALHHENLYAGRNDSQIKNIEEHYGPSMRS